MLLLLLLLALAGCGEEAPEEPKPVSDSVAKQLGFIDPDSSLVAAVDLRVREQNGDHVKDLLSRGLREYRKLDPQADELPEDADAALKDVASSIGLPEQELEPLLDGYAVVGLTVEPAQPRSHGLVPDPELRIVGAFRTEADGLRDAVRKASGRDRLRPVPGHPDAGLLGSSAAVVGDDTLVFAEGGDDGVTTGPVSSGLAAALDRAEDGKGFPGQRLGTAQRATGSDDPLALATGNLGLAGLLVDGQALRRARAEVPLLDAVRNVSAALEVDGDGFDGAVRIATDPGELSPEDLPIGPAGPLELPGRDDAIVGGSRNQSATTSFATKLVRALFRDSRFVRTVEATEAKLEIDFEREFLRQFDCPSVSVFEGAESQQFAARSCVRDPKRMRALLPRLTPELPKILTSLQGLDNEGLVALLLVAPDAPLTPSFGKLLGAVTLKPLRGAGGANRDEQLYELRGLRDPSSRLAFEGPDRVVLGMIGDDFVVGSDRELVRQVADARTERHSREAASVTRVPAQALAGGDERPVQLLAQRLFGALTVSASGERSGVAIDFELPFAGD